MKSFSGKALRWEWNDGVIELILDRAPANEIGTAMLAELEKFVAAFRTLPDTAVCIISSAAKTRLLRRRRSARTLRRRRRIERPTRLAGVRDFLERIHAVINAIDAAPFVTIAAVHGVCFGGGLELALVCDLIIADKMARFCFSRIAPGPNPRLRRNPPPETRPWATPSCAICFSPAAASTPRARKPSAWSSQLAARRRSAAMSRVPTPTKSKNSIATPAPPPKNFSNPFRTRSCARKSIFSANCSRARR